MNAVDYHDTIAQTFGDLYTQSSDFQERHRVWADLLNQYVQLGTQVLDAGCGTGVFSVYAARRGGVVTAIDGSAAMIRLTDQAAEREQVRLTTDTEMLPFLTNKGMFDVVLSSSVLEYVPDLPATLASLDAHVQTGGWLLVSMPNRWSVYRALERVSYWLTRRPPYLQHVLHYSTPTALLRTLGESRYQLISHQTYGGTNALARLLRACLPTRYADTLFVAVFRKK